MKYVSSCNLSSYLTSSLDLLACLSKEQSLPPKSGHKHVAVQAVSKIVQDGNLFPEGSVKTQSPCPEHTLSKTQSDDLANSV